MMYTTCVRTDISSIYQELKVGFLTDRKERQKAIKITSVMKERT